MGTKARRTPVTVLAPLLLFTGQAAARPSSPTPPPAPFMVPLHTYGLLPDGCTIPEAWHPLFHFVGQTTQLLFMLGAVGLMLGYVVSGVYWLVAGPEGKQRAIQWVKHVTVGGLILVLAKPMASWIIQSFSAVPCTG